MASLATASVGLTVNELRGDQRRYEVFQKTRRVLRVLRDLEISTPNRSGLPIIEIPLARHEDIDVIGRYLFERGIYVTMAAYPLVPKNEVGFRVQITAANDDEQIDRLCEVLIELDERYELQHGIDRGTKHVRAAQAREYRA